MKRIVVLLIDCLHARDERRPSGSTTPMMIFRVRDRCHESANPLAYDALAWNGILQIKHKHFKTRAGQKSHYLKTFLNAIKFFLTYNVNEFTMRIT